MSICSHVQQRHDAEDAVTADMNEKETSIHTTTAEGEAAPNTSNNVSDQDFYNFISKLRHPPHDGQQIEEDVINNTSSPSSFCITHPAPSSFPPPCHHHHHIVVPHTRAGCTVAADAAFRIRHQQQECFVCRDMAAEVASRDSVARLSDEIIREALAQTIKELGNNNSMVPISSASSCTSSSCSLSTLDVVGAVGSITGQKRPRCDHHHSTTSGSGSAEE